MREFNVNSPFMYSIAIFVIIFVLAQSFYFMHKAWKRGIELGMDKAVLKRSMMSSGIFTIPPAIAILLGVITLSHALGLPLPWLRMSVIGSITYELPAAELAASAAGASMAQTITDAQVFSTIAWVMTLGILPGLIVLTIFIKKIRNGVMKVGSKDKKWGEIFMSALFLGMISAFLGMIFANVTEGLSGWIPVFVMTSGAIIMGILGIFIKVLKVKWLENYALPISMLGAMALSIPITFWLGG